MESDTFDELLSHLFRFKQLGKRITSNGCLEIGRMPHIGSDAWFHAIGSPLSDENVRLLESPSQLNSPLPAQVRTILELANGMHLFNRVLCINGLRTDYSRKLDNNWYPFSLQYGNVYERPQKMPLEDFVVGYYGDDFYISIEAATNRVYLCNRQSGEVGFYWSSLASMLLEEAVRLNSLHDEAGNVHGDVRKLVPGEQV